MRALAELIGESPGIAAVREQVQRLLHRQSESRRLPPVLILGETGTGKGLLAQAMHRLGPRRDGPFVDVNCAAIPETLLEAELFGFERGAFTDARHAKAGLFQTAHRGTLFLDEVALLPEGLQAKLLKAIEERTVRRLGSTRSEPADAWIVTATNEDLAAAARARRFREDLYHRLAVLSLRLPSLRERGADDVLLLAAHFLARACADYRLPAKTLGADARAALAAYPWPGNVRELANVMERVALLSDAAVVTADLLDLPLPAPAGAPPVAAPPRAVTLEDAVGTVERQHLAEALEETRWNVTRAAARLGISRDTLRYRLEKYGLRRDRREAPGPRRPARPPAPPLAAPGPGEGAAPLGVRWERRRLALLWVGLGFPATADPRLHGSRAHQVLVDKVQSFGGRIEELSPTGIVGAYGLEPVEDAPRRAAHAAMAIRKAAERARQADGPVVAVRAAIHVGQCLVGRSHGTAQIDLEGKREAWRVLEALMLKAEPDEIVVSEAARPFLARDFDLDPTEGLPDGVYRLGTGERAARVPRRMAAFVGRRHELELLRSRLDLASRGHGQVVGILGEPGIGKSRLLAEFRRSLPADLRVTCLEGHCHAYTSAIPYGPVLDILRQNFRIAEADLPEEITGKVRGGLEELEMDPAEWSPYLLRLFGVKEGTERLEALTPSALKFRTFEALRQLTLKGARRRPILFVVEDLNWIDTTSEECFAALMESAAGAPAALFATYRPGYRPPWMDKSYVTQVALQTLGPEESLDVVRSVLEREDVPEPLAQLILEKTEGNPFFLEELTRAIREAGELRPPAAVPDTIEEVLLARIDRLPDEARRLLQTAAVLGRQAPLPLLRALWDGPGDPEPHLRELTRLEFLYATSGGVEPTYAFTHTLTREIAHASLPIERRRALHRTAGLALERDYADRLDEVADRLAYHFARADEAAKAVEYLTRLAATAARGHAHTEAVRILEEARGHVARLAPAEQDRRLLELSLLEAYSLILLGRFQQILELLGRHHAHLERLQDARVAAQYHFLLGRSHLFLGDDDRASAHARAGIAEATRGQDEATLGKIHYVLAQQGAMAGRPREGLAHGQAAIAHLGRANEGWWLGPAYWALGLNQGLLGDFAAALRAEQEADARGEAVGDPQVQSSAAWATGVIRTWTGDWDAGIAACERARELSPDPLNSVLALGWLGYARLEKGEAAAAALLLTQAVELLEELRFPQPRSWFTAYLAEAHGQGGEAARARDLAARALGVAREARSTYGIGLAERALGRLALWAGDLAVARSSLDAACATLGGMGARYDAARATLDLAAASHAAGDRAAARRLLEEAHRQFRTLSVPRYVERTERLARGLGLELAPDGVA